MQAIILAGGLGTRLRSVLPDLPKPMAPVQGKPFLAYLLDYLSQQGVTHVVFLVHHQREKIQDYFKNSYRGMAVDFIIEEEPLGTGGAIANALVYFKETSQPVFVLNGDTFVKLDYRAMYRQHQQNHALLTVALRHMEDGGRYGKVLIDNQSIIDWKEKSESSPGFINAGVYLMQTNLLSSFVLPKHFSFEKDFLLPKLTVLQPQAFITEDYFIDIGIPDDYARAVQELPLVLKAILKSRLPKISIIVPVLNGEKTIEKAICSVINQQYENMELIILDGGSTDKTVDMIKRYEKHITYWHSQYDGSPAVAINAGIEQSTGDLIVLLMSDDWYEPDTFKKIGEASLKHPDADMFTCGGRVVRFDDENRSYVTLQRFTTQASLLLSFYNICFAASAICCRFIKKSLYQQVGLFRQDDEGKHIYSSDKEFLLRVVLAQAKDIFVDYLGHNYLSHQGSATFSYNRKMDMRLCKEHLDTAELFLAKTTLNKNQRFLLKYWYVDQSARLVLYHLLYRDVRKAMDFVRTGIKKYHVIWPIAFIYTTVKILIKRFLHRVC